MKTHLRFLWCCLALICVTVTSRAQLTGTIAVPSTTYPTLAAVVDSLNNQGVGTGGVIVNLNANETAPVGGYRLGSATLNASTSTSKRVIINGGGKVITAYVGTSTTADGIFYIQGTDWVEINALNLTESAANTSSTTRMEWGYSLVKLSSTAPYDGCQNVLINGCTITLEKTYSSTIGIRLAHTQAGSTTTLGTGSVTVASTNSYNNFTSNTISGVTRGFSLVGINSTAANMDRDNRIGGTSVATGNSITYGGAGNTSYGVFTQNDSVMTVRNNKFFIGSGQTTTSYGYQASTGMGNLTVTNNVFDVNVSAASATVYAYYNASGHRDPSSGINSVTTHTISGNTVTGANPTATSAAFYGFYSDNEYCLNMNMTNNTVRDIDLPLGTSGAFYGFYVAYSYAPKVNVQNNTVYNINKPNNSASSTYGVYVYEYSHSTGDLNIERNVVRKLNWRYYLQPFYIYGPYYTPPPAGYPQSKMYFRYNVIDSIDFSSVSARTSTYLYSWVYYGMDTVDKSYNRCTNIIGPSNNNSINLYSYYLYSYSQGAMSTLNHRHVGNVVDNIQLTGTANNYVYNALGYYAEISDSNVMSNHTIPNGAVYNYLSMYGGNMRAVGNVVKNMNFTGNCLLYTYMGYAPNGTFEGYGNVTDSIALNTGQMYGWMCYAQGNPWRFHNNRVSRVYVQGTGNALYPYYMQASSASAPMLLYNNFLTDIQLPSGFNSASSSGFYLANAADYKLYHNTIRISSPNNGGFTGIYYPTTGTLDLRNNIINVNVSPGTSSAFTVALRRQSGAAGTPPLNFLPTSNGNIYYTPTGTNSWLYGEGSSAAGMVNTYSLTNDPQFNTPCGLFKNFMSHDFGSFTENNLVPATTIGTYRPNGAIASFAQNGAVPTAPAITNDYDGVARGTLADMGALEFTGTTLDQAPPVITYTPVPTMSYCVTKPQIIATITDVTGVDTTRTVGSTAGRAPRLYFKKANNNTTDLDLFSNLVSNNNSSFNGWKWVEPTTIVGNTYTFDFDYSLLRSAVLPGDSIKYFIIAQDLATTPNTGFNIAAFTVCPNTVSLGAANSPTLVNPKTNGYRIMNTPNFMAVSFPPAACLSGSTTISIQPIPYGTGVQWQSATLTGAFSNITGANGYTYTTPVHTSTTRYRAILSCGSATLATSKIDTFIIANPSIVSTTGDTRCGEGPVTLTATGAPFTTPKWYSVATGGKMVGSGNSFTDTVKATKTYYVSGITSNASMETVGAPKPSTYSNASQVAGIKIQFNNASTNFYSTTVYPWSSTVGGTVDIELWDSAAYMSGSGTTGPIASTTMTIPFSGNGSTPVVVQLGSTNPAFRNIAPGTYYLIGTNQSSGAWLHYHYDLNAGWGPSPFVSPSGGTIIKTAELASGTQYYYYFYNNVFGADCESSTRTPVIATVIPAPVIDAYSPDTPGVCIGASATLNVTSLNPYYVYTWQPGSMVGTTFTVTPSATTQYRVTAVDPYTGCVTRDTVLINVNTQPAPPVLTPSPANICAGKSVQLTASAPPGMAGLGSLGTGTSSTSTAMPVYSIYTRSQVHYIVTRAELNAMGIVGPNLLTSWAFNVASTGYKSNNFAIKIGHTTLTSLSTVNCSNAYSGLQTVYTQAAYTATSGWNTFNFQSTFSWNGVDNIIIAAMHDNDPLGCGTDYSSSPTVYYHTTSTQSAAHIYADAGYCNTTSCTPTGYGPYTYNYRPNMRIGFMAPGSVNWLNVTRLFKNSGLTNAVSLTDTVKSPYAAPTVTTVYTAITNLFGCKSLPSLPDTVYVTPSPDVTITPAGPQTICAGQTVTLCIPTAVNQTYQWYLNNNPISGGTSNCFTATAAGSYKVTATNIVTGCANTSIDVPVTVNPAPSVTVTRFGAKVVCKGVTDTLVASGTNLVSYQWKQNGVNIAGATSPSLIVTTSGIYTVEVTNNNNCVGTSAPDTITVNVTPTTITPMGPTTFCNGMTVTLQGPTPPTGVTYIYQWRENGVSIPGATGSSHTTGLTGSYTVVVTNTTTGCTDSSVATVVNVGPPPSSMITPNGAVGLCQGGSVTLNAISQPGLSYQWLNNGTPISGATSATYVATASGVYTVQVSITGTPGCGSVGDNNANITVNPLPTATATAAGPTTFCQGGNVVINAGTNAANATYQWNLGGNPIQGQTGSSITVATAGNYTVTVTNTTTTCSNVSNTVAVTVNTLPVTAVTSATPTTFCQGGNVNLCVTAGATSYQWRVNGNPITGATSNCYTASTTGIYSVTVTGTNGCVATSQQTSVQVNALPDVTTVPTGNTAVCQGYSINLSVGADTNYTYQWMLNNVNISGQTNATYSTGSAGTYKVKVTNKVTGCTATSADIIVSVNTPPTATAALIGPNTICQGDSTRINANTGTGFTYQWRRNGVNIAGETNAVFYAKQSGSYTVNISNATNCFNISNSVVITVNPRPAAYITYNTPLEFCEGSAVVLNANTGTGLTYQWLLNGAPIGNTGTFNEAKTSGKYALLVTNNFSCTTSSDTLNILVHPTPVPLISRTGTTLETTTPYVSYQWFFNNEPIGGATNQSHNYTENGAYKVRVIDIYGCEGMSNLFFVNNVGVNTAGAGKSIRVYPNPTTGLVNIEASVKVKLVLRDVAGKAVLEASDVKQINLGDIANGMYLLYISDMNGNLLRADKITKTAH